MDFRLSFSHSLLFFFVLILVGVFVCVFLELVGFLCLVILVIV